MFYRIPCIVTSNGVSGKRWLLAVYGHVRAALNDEIVSGRKMRKFIHNVYYFMRKHSTDKSKRDLHTTSSETVFLQERDPQYTREVLTAIHAVDSRSAKHPKDARTNVEAADARAK